ncbi:MAG: hypothetical protein V6Z89_09745 [Desulfobacter sp.]
MQTTSAGQNRKPTIYWILQKNHVSPFIVDFLNFFRTAAPNVNLRFLIPSLWEETIELAKDLTPESFDVRTLPENTQEWYDRKRESIKGLKFKEGLSAWRTFVLDDFHGGNVNLLAPELPNDPTLQCMLMQIPVPLGSYANEEGVFHACMQWARARKVPVIGYELLPFDTKWTLIPSLLDGVITTNERSYDWLTSNAVGLKNKVWLLPRYESHFFSSAATYFWRNALGLPYNTQYKEGIPNHITVLHIPHNVAMSHEYKTLIKALGKRGSQLHLMISIGKDQVRGTHTHQETVDLLSRQDLAQFHSYSFCDLNKPANLACADAVVACSSCHLSDIATLNSIPTVIFDPDVSKGRYGHTTTVNTREELDVMISRVIKSHGKITKLGDVFSQVLDFTMNRAKKQETGNEFRL